ncbi:DUF2278 family protein [Bacillus clarus]|uniref:DUF2278 family protein n=1 Tax=Bacillus clarus TaxID=2338372 RepID=A0A090Z1U7_9BACI|nr:YukJ family protein [Bacillus clarus]KFN04358.1 hypothetical protein DJ93_5351 [Bacillus clarus]RFT66365.1 DUF2278 family protein [Bacillus clarus]
MGLLNYGVLKGKVKQFQIDNDNKTPHMHVKIQGENTKTYTIIINVKSKKAPSEILYYAGENFNSEQITHLPDLEYGFTPIGDSNSNIALDYIRGNLLDPCTMVPLPVNAAGKDNDLKEKLELYMSRAQKPEVDIYAYGDKIPPGIHDVHMNQGNVEEFFEDDGIWQDGGVLLHFKNTNNWVAIFLAFQSQSWCTDDDGHATKPVEECNHKSGC